MKDKIGKLQGAFNNLYRLAIEINADRRATVEQFEDKRFGLLTKLQDAINDLQSSTPIGKEELQKMIKVVNAIRIEYNLEERIEGDLFELQNGLAKLLKSLPTPPESDNKLTQKS